MNFQSTILLLLISFLLGGCTAKEYVTQNAAFILFKTPTFKYADMGFLYEDENEIKVEIYGSGQAMVSLRITESSVCMSHFECMGKKRFNKEVLSSRYPDALLENIFRGRPIFSGIGLDEKGEGFTQKIIKKDKYNIEYTVLNQQIVFRDTINSILIQVKKQY
ncbi:MAG TPA: hypothetical protein VIM88_05805 [Sulfurovum sp.]|uniref:hypothetical protein n=1 Tax=Sulfurovum sp. TaxID=1969726 RepID=UPI002F92F7B9